MKNPAHRYESIKTMQTTPQNTHDAELYMLLSNGSCSNKNIAEAYDIYQHEYKREVLEACLLSDMSDEEISNLLKLPVPIVQEYKYFFFDPSIFSSLLDKTDYAYTYEKSEFGADLKKMAVDLGKECLKIRLGGPDQTLPANYIVNSIRATACLLANMVRTNKMNPNIANMALRWANVALKAVDAKEESNVDNVFDTLKIQLEKITLENDNISDSEITH